MNKIVKKTLPVLLTSAAVIIALLVLRHLWSYYMDEPWTRDAHVSADVVQVAPDVSGLIQQVQVRDNQLVKRGQVLFTIDQDRFKLALRQARAAVADRQETLAQAQRDVAAGPWAGWRGRRVVRVGPSPVRPSSSATIRNSTPSASAVRKTASA